MIRELNAIEAERLRFLQDSGIKYCLVEPTENGMAHSITDATQSVQDHFKESGLHDYENQGLVAIKHRKLVPVVYLQPYDQVVEEGSLYRPKSRGRKILRLSGIRRFAKPHDVLVLHSNGNDIVVVNISAVDPQEIVRNSTFSSFGEVAKISSDRAVRGSIETAFESLEISGDFDPDNEIDAREFELRAIASRRGQPKFRRKLIEEYEGRCVISRTSCQAVLEAAHIRPYNGSRTNHLTNGLLLRSDLHTLFDSFLIAVNSSEMKVLVADELRDTEYSDFRNVVLHKPRTKKASPSVRALDWHRAKAGL